MFSREFDRQVDNLLHKGYPALVGISPEDFVKRLDPLKTSGKELTTLAQDPNAGRIAFVIVVNHTLVVAEETMLRVERAGKNGLISMHPVTPQAFKPIDTVPIPEEMAYLLVDIDRGEATRNIAPEEALPLLHQENRSPLTIAEGIAVLTQHPEFLQKNHCFSLLASRCGDKRVPALWLSADRPKLGWCWAGNPHTWLGSASCANRLTLAKS